LAGPRTVPIEIGSKYTDENWSQKLMTIEEFIHKFILIDQKEQKEKPLNQSKSAKGYLAQHPLFDQVCLEFDFG